MKNSRVPRKVLFGSDLLDPQSMIEICCSVIQNPPPPTPKKRWKKKERQSPVYQAIRKKKTAEATS